MTITMEVGDIKRFADPGNFASYCRTVEAKRMSNSKKKGANNSKCGNKYLAWAFVEAANFARRYDEQCRRWYDRKAAKTSNVHRDQGAGLQAGQGRLVSDGRRHRLRSDSGCLGNQQKRNENLNLGARPSAS